MNINKTIISFRYKALSDIITVIIISIAALIGFFIVNSLITESIILTIYGIAAMLCIFVYLINIYIKTFNHLSVGVDEVIFHSGWFTKTTTSIPAHKIRSCSKTSGILQRACKTMDISITTAGDAAEIYFTNIENGEEAYGLISNLAKIKGRPE